MLTEVCVAPSRYRDSLHEDQFGFAPDREIHSYIRASFAMNTANRQLVVDVINRF